LLIFYLSEKV